MLALTLAGQQPALQACAIYQLKLTLSGEGTRFIAELTAGDHKPSHSAFGDNAVE